MELAVDEDREGDEAELEDAENDLEGLLVEVYDVHCLGDLNLGAASDFSDVYLYQIVRLRRLIVMPNH